MKLSWIESHPGQVIIDLSRHKTQAGTNTAAMWFKVLTIWQPSQNWSHYCCEILTAKCSSQFILSICLLCIHGHTYLKVSWACIATLVKFAVNKKSFLDQTGQVHISCQFCWYWRNSPSLEANIWPLQVHTMSSHTQHFCQNCMETIPRSSSSKYNFLHAIPSRKLDWLCMGTVAAHQSMPS